MSIPSLQTLCCFTCTKPGNEKLHDWMIHSVLETRYLSLLGTHYLKNICLSLFKPVSTLFQKEINLGLRCKEANKKMEKLVGSDFIDLCTPHNMKKEMEKVVAYQWFKNANLSKQRAEEPKKVFPNTPHKC